MVLTYKFTNGIEDMQQGSLGMGNPSFSQIINEMKKAHHDLRWDIRPKKWNLFLLKNQSFYTQVKH